MIFNIVGAVMMVTGLVLAFVTGGLVEWMWPNTNKGIAVGSGVFFLVTGLSDLVYRWKNFRERGRSRFVNPLTGGMIFFAPLWILFGLLPLLALPVMMIVLPPKKDPPRRVTSAPTIINTIQEFPCDTAHSARLV